MDLKFQVQTKIQKPCAEVLDAVYASRKLSEYFTNGGASGPLDEGTTVEWSFDDTPGQAISVPVKVVRMVPNELIVLEWQSRTDGGNTHIEMKFEAAGLDATIVQISESGWSETQADLDRSYGNCMGWAQMVSALKAFSEYGINFRKGAYEGLYPASEHESTRTIN